MESTGSAERGGERKGLEMDIYTYIQRCWAPLSDRSSKDVERPTEVTPKERQRERERQRGRERETSTSRRGHEGGGIEERRAERLAEKITNRGGVVQETLRM